MRSSTEAQWQSETARRRRIIRFMLLVVLIFLLLLIGLWFWVTQPLLTSARSNSERTVDPSRLKAHVRKATMRNASPLPVYSINAPSFVTGIDFSDQLNYWHAGYSAVMITDTAFYRNPNYHTAEDTEEKLDYERMAMVVEGVYATVTELTRE